MSEVYCEASLNYAGLTDYEPRTVPIRNGREAISDLSYEQCGFSFIRNESKVKNWQDEAEVDSVHVPEIAELVTELMGCKAAVVYPALVRSPKTAKQLSDYAPIESVHSDYTEDYRKMVRDPDHAYQDFLNPLLKANGLSHEDVVNAERIAVIQFWRNIGAEHPDRPLALCDASTVDRSEMIPILVPFYGGVRLDFEAFAVRTPEKVEDHHWYAFPKMQKDEVMVFRTYDSRCDDEGRAFYTPHTAFLDPTAGTDAPLRESVEMRALCLF